MLRYRRTVLFVATLMVAATIVNLGLNALAIVVDVFAQLWN
jgi:hypothetical protein